MPTGLTNPKTSTYSTWKANRTAYTIGNGGTFNGIEVHSSEMSYADFETMVLTSSEPMVGIYNGHRVIVDFKGFKASDFDFSNIVASSRASLRSVFSGEVNRIYSNLTDVEANDLTDIMIEHYWDNNPEKIFDMYAVSLKATPLRNGVFDNQYTIKTDIADYVSNELTVNYDGTGASADAIVNGALKILKKDFDTNTPIANVPFK